MLTPAWGPGGPQSALRGFADGLLGPRRIRFPEAQTRHGRVCPCGITTTPGPAAGPGAPVRSLWRRFCPQAKRRDPRDGINNRISTNIGFAPNYDNDGDLLGDPVRAQQDVNAFDAEGHAVTLEGIGVTYDALGRAVEAAEPGGAIEFLYAPGGGKLAVMNGQTLLTAYIPLPGGGTAVYHGATLAYYRHADWLGSSRLASTPGRALYSATAYAPYGEPHEEAGTIDRNFTGQNQDINSSHSGGQYDFLMREYNPIQGRWWTPDPAGLAAVDPNNPQSWNRYAYVSGVPLEATDPSGLCPKGTHDAKTAEMAAAIKVAESYQGEAHSSGTHFGANSIDCSGLIMCALVGASRGSPFATSYLGLNLTTRNIDQWTDPGTGAIGDIIYFATPGHVGIVTGPNQFFGAQSRHGVGFASFGLSISWWGNPADTSAPVFRRACIANQQATIPASASAVGRGAGAGAGDIASGGSPLGILGLGGVTGNWGDVLGMLLSATMPGGTVTTTQGLQCISVGGKKACF